MTTDRLGTSLLCAVIANLLYAGTALASCGSGNISGSKTCDTTNAGSLGCSAAGSGLETECRAPGTTDQCTCCGDGIVQSSEECDDGAANSDTTPNACRTDCTRASCGDDVTDPGVNFDAETCDGASGGSNCTAAGSGLPDACRADCTCCGDFAEQPGAGEQCDLGPNNNDTTPDACRTNCLRASCGDNVTDTGIGETCDGTSGGTLCTAAGSGSFSECRADCSCCGDFVIDPGETCDDGNQTAGDGCDFNCTPTGCGNGITTGGEFCDDGNLIDGDGCDSNCTPTGCGNGIVTAGEECDDGNATDGDDCDSNCTRTACGNGILTSGESCDGTSTGSGACSAAGSGSPSACRADCTCCGDGFTDTGEQCDDGTANSDTANACRTNCRFPTCGDNITDFDINFGETCDGSDGGAVGCSAAGSGEPDACRADCSCCGDGHLDAGEECDDGIANSDTGDACRTNCLFPICGDNIADTHPDFGETCDGTDLGTTVCTSCRDAADAEPCSCCGDGVKEPSEECDNGALNSNTTPNACRTNCVNASCGDNVVDTGETCDGTSAGTVGCAAKGSGGPNACRGTYATEPCSCCGDGEVNGGEECDDGNTSNNDCCTNACRQAVCGDSFIQAAVCTDIPTEECDDGNTNPGDTCSATCQIEPRLSVSEKGSILYYSGLEVGFSPAATTAGPGFALSKDTFITLVNDLNRDVCVEWHFINGDDPLAAIPGIERAHPGWNSYDCVTCLTPHENVFMSLARADGSLGCQPFTGLDPGTPPGRPDPDGLPGDRIVRGYAIAFAVDIDGNPISWNHLSGHATVVDYRNRSAWEYNTYAFPCVADPVAGNPCGTDPTTLSMDGLEYALAWDRLLFDFYAVTSTAFSRLTPATAVTLNTELTLYPVSADLRPNSTNTGGPVITRADIVIWNENEDDRTGTSRCIDCWDQTLLSNYDAPNNFLLELLNTNKGYARINGVKSDSCDGPGSCCCRQQCSISKADCENSSDCPAFGPNNLLQTCGLFNCFDPDCTQADIIRGNPDRDCSENAALLGLSDKILTFGGAAPRRTDAAMTLVGIGTQPAAIRRNVIQPTAPLRDGIDTKEGTKRSPASR